MVDLYSANLSKMEPIYKPCNQFFSGHSDIIAGCVSVVKNILISLNLIVVWRDLILDPDHVTLIILPTLELPETTIY